MIDHSRTVLIIGAGLSGLTLAQILQTNGIPCRVFDRDDGVDPRNQGWSVSLDECLDDLESSLPKHLGDIYTTSPNFEKGIPDGGTILDARTGSIIAKKGGVPKGQRGHFLKANRAKLRQYLSQGIPIETNKHFSHYIDDGNGNGNGNGNGVTAYFKDGSSAHGSILVGADGASSPVRSQLLNGAHANVAPFVPISGSCTLTDPELITSFFTLTNTATMTVDKERESRTVIGLLAREPDDSMLTLHYAVSYRPANAQLESSFICGAAQSSLFERILDLTTNLPYPLRQIIASAGPESINIPQTRFMEFVPPGVLPRGRVTLMGDAAHAMMPFKGAGANAALKDACELGRVLCAADGGESVVDLLEEYSRAVCETGRRLVLASREASREAGKMLGVDRT